MMIVLLMMMLMSRVPTVVAAEDVDSKIPVGMGCRRTSGDRSQALDENFRCLSNTMDAELVTDVEFCKTTKFYNSHRQCT